MKKRMIIIGANGSATKRTIPALVDSEICEIVAIQSRNQEKLQQTCQTYNIPHYYQDSEEMLAKEEYDLVFIANPPFLHYQTIAQCLTHDVPIICEKPLARNYQEAQAIATLLADYHQPLMIAHHMRHQPAYTDLKEILQRDEIGQVCSVWAQWGFNINRQSASSAWKLDRLLGGGGTFSDNGIHALDFIIGLFGPPQQVTGYCHQGDFKETYSNETLLLNYQNSTITINSSHNLPYSGNHLLIYGTKGKIESNACFGEKSISQIIVTTETVQVIDYPVTNLYKNEVENFINCHLLNKVADCCGTTLSEQLLALKLIDELRSAL